MMRTISRWRSSRVVRARTPETPRMPFSGVRISWLMLATNSLLAMLAAWAVAFAACSRAMALPTPAVEAVFDHDEAGQEVGRAAGQGLAGEVGGQGRALDHQGRRVHHHRDRAHRIEGAAILGGHAQGEGVPLDQADGTPPGVDHGHRQGVRLALEPPEQGLAQGLGSDGGERAASSRIRSIKSSPIQWAEF